MLLGVFGDHAGVLANFGILGSHGENLLHFGIGLDVVAGGCERPRVAVQRQNVAPPGELAFSQFQGLRRLCRIVDDSRPSTRD